MAQQRLMWVNPNRWTDIRAVPTGPRARWQHPTNGQIVFNPKPSEDLNIYPVWEGGPRPDLRTRDVVETLAFDQVGRRVVASYTSTPKDVMPFLETRIAELKQRARQEGAKGAGPWDQEALDLAVRYAALALIRGKDPQRVNLLADKTGTWHELTDTQIEDIVELYATRQKAVLTAVRFHSEALRGYAAGGQLQDLLDHSLDSQWPE